MGYAKRLGRTSREAFVPRLRGKSTTTQANHQAKGEVMTLGQSTKESQAQCSICVRWPGTAEHLVECYHLRKRRKDNGLSPWKHVIKVGHVFHDPELTFEERRNVIVAIIKVSRWYADDKNFELSDCVDELEQCRNIDEFDDAWGLLYDLADMDSVWIDTFPPAERKERE